MSRCCHFHLHHIVNFEMAVTIDQHKGFKPYSRSHKCRLQSFSQYDYNNMLELTQTNLAHSLKQAFDVANIRRSFSTPCLSLATHVEDEFDTKQRIEIIGGRAAPRVRALVVEVAIALASAIEPIPVSSGLGGAYFLSGRNGDVIAVAKPVDEEPLAFNNPKGFGGLMPGQPGLKRSIRVGETGIRELAAYLLDHDGFAGVPPTALVKISDVGFNVNDRAANSSTAPYKIASLQRFVHHEFDSGELGPSNFSVASIHRIGIFDVRLLNLDRHAGNILVKKHERQENYAGEAAELVPIDHGLCLPEWLDDPYFEWLHWPQASVPFSESEVEYMCDLDPYQDAEILRTELPSLQESSIRVLILCTIFLKRAAVAGLSLADMGEIMTREFSGGEENWSVLESICAKAKETVIKNVSDNDGDVGSNERTEENEEEEFELFHFDKETEDNFYEMVYFRQSMENSLNNNMSLPPNIPRLSCLKSMLGLHDAGLSPLYEENGSEDTQNDKKITKGNGSTRIDENKVEALTRSMSFSVQNRNCVPEGITFGDMNENQWDMFLETFEELLPQVFEGIKGMGVKKRLGSSCEF